MKTAKQSVDIVIILLLLAAGYICFSRTELIVTSARAAGDDFLFTLVGTLFSIIVSSVSAIFGILIAVYLLSSQATGRKPYSRLVRSFYDSTDLYYFGILFLALLIPVLVYAFWNMIRTNSFYFLVDTSIILYIVSLLCLVAIMLKHLGVFDPKIVAERALRVFNTTTVLQYGLVQVEKNNLDQQIKFKLKSWGHRHNLSDPLGPYHDILMEAIQERERITFHLYLSVLLEKMALLNGVRYERQFGLAAGNLPRITFRSFMKNIPTLMPIERIETRVQVVIHALHYLVRRAQKLTQEWGIDNHRQIFVINIADLILALCKHSSNGILIEICHYAVLKICLDYKLVQPFGSYEPLKDYFALCYKLQKAGFNRETKIGLQVLAFIDNNTPFISTNSNIDMSEVLFLLPQELNQYYSTQKSELQNKQISEVFPNNIWQ